MSCAPKLPEQGDVARPSDYRHFLGSDSVGRPSHHCGCPADLVT